MKLSKNGYQMLNRQFVAWLAKSSNIGRGVVERAPPIQ